MEYVISQKSTFSKKVCHRHYETCNMSNTIKANVCFYLPIERVLNISDNFITVSVKSLPCYLCKGFSQVKNENQEMDLCHFNKKDKLQKKGCCNLLCLPFRPLVWIISAGNFLLVILSCNSSLQKPASSQPGLVEKVHIKKWIHFPFSKKLEKRALCMKNQVWFTKLCCI